MPVLLLLAFILVPLAELYVISRVAHLVGLPLTLGVLLVVSVVGATVVKREGLRTWRTLQAALRSGRMPPRALSDAALVLIGGVLLLTPGFLTDAAGLLLVLPPTRAVARRLLTTLVLRRVVSRSRQRSAGRPRGGAQGMVIDGEVITDEDAKNPRSG